MFLKVFHKGAVGFWELGVWSGKSGVGEVKGGGGHELSQSAID
jgi:hypothetical protein